MKSNTMSYEYVKNKNSQNKVVFRASYKDPLTKKYKQIVRTFDVSQDIINKERKLKEYLLQCENLVIQEKENILNKYKDDYLLHEQAKKILFCDYAKQWIEDILVRSPMSYHYKTDCLSNFKILEEHFQKLTLTEMTHKVVKDFCDWLRVRTYTKCKAVCKKELKPLIKERKMTLDYVAKNCDICISTIDEASKIGSSVKYENAKVLCDFLKIPLNEYFSVSTTVCKYSKSSNNTMRWLVSSVLGDAVREGYISTNYASSEYISPMTGTKRVREQICSENEFRQFISHIKDVQDIRKRTIFMISSCFGLRVCEISGLSWDNINFFNKTIEINKNVMEIYRFGIVEKNTKTDSSNRKLYMPPCLEKCLIEYKNWWDKTNLELGDLWKNKNYLFINDKGNPIVGRIINKWLKEYEETYNLKKITIHGIRHAVLSTLNNSNINRKTISKIAGHSKVATTDDYYIDSFEESDILAINKIDEIISESI